MKILFKTLFAVVLITSMSCRKTVETFPFDGEWKMNFNVTKSINEQGVITIASKTVNFQMKISVINGKITGNYLSVVGGCGDADLTGTIATDNTFEMTSTYKGSCCGGAQIKMTGKLTSTDTFEATGEPVGVPPSRCITWWGNITATRVK